MGKRITIEPTSEPVTLTEAKTHLRVDNSVEDTYITSLITVARKICESYTNRVFITQTWLQTEDDFDYQNEIEINPVQSITVKYYDEDDVIQTIASSDIQLDTSSDVAAFYEGLTFNFPTTGSRINPIEITVVAGYGDASKVPLDIKQAILLIVSHFYENRQGLNVTIASITTQIELPKVVKAILSNYRIRIFG